MQEHGFTTVKGYQFMYDMAERYGIPKAQVKTLIDSLTKVLQLVICPLYVMQFNMLQNLLMKVGSFIALHPSENKYAQRPTTQELDKLFGKGVFTKLVCPGTGDDKDEALAKYKDSNFGGLKTSL